MLTTEQMKTALQSAESKMPPIRPTLKTEYDYPPYSRHADAAPGSGPVPSKNLALTHPQLQQSRAAYASAAHCWGSYTLHESDVELTTRARIAASGASTGRQCRLLADALGISQSEAACRVGMPFGDEDRAAKPEDRPATSLRLARDIAQKSGGTIVATVEEIERATMLASKSASETAIAYKLANRNGTNVCDELALLRDVPKEAHAVALFAMSQRAADTADKNTPEARRAAHFADPNAASAAMAARYSPATAAWLSRAGRLP